LRSGRRNDKALAFWALLGAVAWIALMVWLMQIAHMWRDPRPWLFIGVCIVLVIFGTRDLLRRRRGDASGAFAPGR
jgi:hypothetical protein